ncbi:hypothetical protein ACFQS3_17810 [Glycomyces mayteni]|uniref:Uncharacterized protein n=1 Tax=Glycomyces mayteni TaxID=543887 RepID=A0ABW2DCY6_9ACTN
MSTPDETLFEEAFAEFAHSAELMVDPVDSAVIHGRVRRRRTTKGALAAALAALIVAVPAAWWLQDSNGQEVDPQPAETSTGETSEGPTSPAEGGTGSGEVPEGQETETELVLPTFADLVGAEIELPAFVPGSSSYDSACPVSPAVPADGTPDAEAGEWDAGGGPVQLLKVVHTPLEEGGPVQAVALFGCSPSESMMRQAVVVAGDGEGGWEVTEEVARGDITEFPLWDIAPAATAGVLLLVPEQESTGMYQEIALDYDVFRYRTGEELANVTDDAYLWGVTDLSVAVEKTDNGDGTWTGEVTVTNSGDHDSHGVQLALCASESLGADGPEPVPVCEGYPDGVAVLDPLEAGDSTTLEWTLTPEPFGDWNGDEQAGGLYFEAWIQPLVYSVDNFVFDPHGENDYDNTAIIIDDVPTS